jgi:hypothetical protein
MNRAVERILDTVTQNDAFIRLITKGADGLTTGRGARLAAPVTHST